MKTADLYIRVSTDEQAEKGYSLRSQQEVLQKYCELNFIKIRDIFIEDYSAKTFKRPIWQNIWYSSNVIEGRRICFYLQNGTDLAVIQVTHIK